MRSTRVWLRIVRVIVVNRGRSNPGQVVDGVLARQDIIKCYVDRLGYLGYNCLIEDIREGRARMGCQCADSCDISYEA